MATIRDVARLAGVSTATVSHVLNDTRAVSEDLRERVRLAMEELNYRPNAVARSLRVSETRTIGLIVPDVELPFFARYARTIERIAAQSDYNIILCNSNWLLSEELRYLDHLLARRVDGLICISVTMTAKHIGPILRRNAPVIWLEEARHGDQCDSVALDNARGAYLATSHLIQRGHRRIACIIGPVMSQLGSDRMAGYQQALVEHHIPFDQNLLGSGDYTAQSGYLATQKLLECAERPTAIFCFNDLMAMGAIRALSEAGLRVPDDMAVIGFDGVSLTEQTCPPLSTVEQPIAEMSKIAVEMLIERINGSGPAQYRTVMLEPKLIIRESTLGVKHV